MTEEKQAAVSSTNDVVNRLKKLSKKNWLIIGAIVVVLLGFFMWKDYQNKHLSGSYKAEVNLVLTSATDTMTFDGDKVTEKNDGATNKGTYSIKGDQVTVKLDGESYTGKLSSDRSSFDMNISGMHLTYKK
ncbi:hypothetical protein [Fructobacillus fructosus]|uniref:hypothetical protein n=1 Tax=Fructobacillus fructosus TaxID=1631 RepID=UPI002DB0EC78|nr:hypothetical protein LMG30235_GOPAMIKF_01265 [Fructobacillus fructosus]CAK1251029.1 hypothetical protein LMG30234_GAICNKDF_01399 [Fructobacillus fructosus]CAK1251031.1 hypothetical protein R54866_LGPIEIPA_01395 [Fructobacillus fructosus]